jgi:hypothetical protein
MTAAIGFLFMIVGYACMAAGTTAMFLYGVFVMFTGGFLAGLLIAILGPMIVGLVGVCAMFVGTSLMEAS